MKSIRSFFLSRSTVTTLLVAILLELLAAGIVPQRFLTPVDAFSAWHQANPVLSQVVVFLGLDHLYTSPLFAVTLTIFSLSLALSTYEQCVGAWRKTLAPPKSLPRKEKGVPIADVEALCNRLAASRYIRTWSDGESSRYIRNPWGHWGLPLLHLGLLILIGASLLVFLTSSRGLLELYEGQIAVAGDPMNFTEHGLFAPSPSLPMTVRMTGIQREYWDTDELKQLALSLQFINPDGSRDDHRLVVNRSIRYKGLKIHQSMTSGKAFFLEFLDGEGGVNRGLLLIPRPLSKDSAGYRDFRLPWMFSRLHAKYYSDADRKWIEGERPQLVLRLGSDEVSLLPGENGRIGSFDVRLVDVKNWAGIVFADSFGMAGLFAGFCLLLLGCFLQYLTPPREVFLVSRTGEMVSVYWRAGRLTTLDSDEFEHLQHGLREGLSTRTLKEKKS